MSPISTLSSKPFVVHRKMNSSKIFDLGRHLTTCKEKVKHVFPKNVYQLRETLFDKIDSFHIPYSEDQKLFNNMAIFDFELICVQEDKFRDIEPTKWIDKHVPISVSISSNLIEQPPFQYKSNPAAVAESFVDALDGLATQSKEQMKLTVLEIQISVKTQNIQTPSTLNQSHCRREPVLEFEKECIEEEERDVSTQFLQTQKNQLIHFQNHLLWIQLPKI